MNTATFPIGAIGASPLPLDLLCSAATAAVFAIQSGDTQGLGAIYQHLKIQPRNYADATKQLATGWSLGGPLQLMSAIAPTQKMIEGEASAVYSAAMRGKIEPEEEPFREDLAVSLALLDTLVEDSLRSGNIQNVLAYLDRADKIFDSGQGESAGPEYRLRFVEYWARVGHHQKAAEYLDRALAVIDGVEHEGTRNNLRFFAVMTLLHSGAIERARQLMKTVTDQIQKFTLSGEAAKALRRFRHDGEAVDCLLNEAAEIARRAPGRQCKVNQLKVVFDMLMDMRRTDEAKTILDELIAPEKNLISDHRGGSLLTDLAWAALQMDALGYELKEIVEMLTRGWIHEDELLAEDPSGKLLRRMQADCIRHRWENEGLGDIPDRWEKGS